MDAPVDALDTTDGRVWFHNESPGLEAYDEMGLALDLRTEVHTRADKLSVAYRRLLADLVGASQGEGG